jgi:hypothetical protein
MHLDDRLVRCGLGFGDLADLDAARCVRRGHERSQTILLRRRAT